MTTRLGEGQQDEKQVQMDGGEGGFEHDPQQSGLQLADSTLPGWLSMPRLPWLLGPHWPMVEIDVVTLSWADLAPHLLHFFPGKC